ncbi:MAG: 3-phosphoshikimate 1-carboxyvinyltransferase [Verrucomicrobiales bacterium]
MSHRAVLIAALSNGPCKITGFLNSEDCLATVDAVKTLGIRVDIDADDPTTLTVYGKKGVFEPPSKPEIDCGNSGTTMRLFAGILAALPVEVRLVGDASLSRRPMGRIIEPLRLMGAKIEGQEQMVEGKNRITAPLSIQGAELNPIEYHSPVASAQIKSCVLLAGLMTPGRTVVYEPAKSRDHTERMLGYFQVPVHEFEGGCALRGGQVPEARDFHVPGDISSAAFWIVAAACQPGSHLIVTGVGLNPTRTGLVSVLLRMGANIRETVEETAMDGQGERLGRIEVRGSQLQGTTIGIMQKKEFRDVPTVGEDSLGTERREFIIEDNEIPRLIDELPILAVAGALAQGDTIIRDAEELRVKETDRIAVLAKNLRAMGVSVQETQDGMIIRGGLPLQGAKLESHGDHRIAMAFAIAGLFAEGDTVIRDVECINTSYPGFIETLSDLVRTRRSPMQTTSVITDVRDISVSTEGLSEERL